MRILLINPPYTTEDRYGKDLGKFGPVNEPLGLAYLAATLEDDGHRVSILDAPALDLTPKDICRSMEEKGYDLVGVTMLTPMYGRSVEVIKAIKRLFSDMTVVVGGPHATILPKETLIENSEIDFAVIGEGEIVFLNLVNALETESTPNNVAGIAYRKDDTVAINPPPVMIADLDQLPLPARHLLPMQHYHMTRSRSRSDHAFIVSVARGCPFNCAFCCRIFGRKIRHHSVDRIIKEIDILVNNYGAKEINLESDSITTNKHFIDSLCDGIIDSGLFRKISWTCESRVDTVNEDILKKMKAAGCWQISYGVETGAQRLLKAIHKDITLEQIENTFTITKKIGISIRAFFMLGIPTETRPESMATIAFAKKLDARWSQFTLCTPFPGTEFYEMASKEGGLKTNRWDDFKTHGGWTKGGLAYVPQGRSMQEMKKLQKRAYRAVYLRPRVFMRLFREIDSLAKIKEYGIGFWVLLKTAFPSNQKTPRVIRVAGRDLERFARGVHVASPVYFSLNHTVRFINWQKLEQAFSLLQVLKRQSVLDFGCGNGVMLPTLSDNFDTVIGIDLHTTASFRMKKAYGLENVFLATADGTKLPFKVGSFYTVLATSVLEHIRDLDEAASEISRIIKPGGFLLFLSPTENIFYKAGRFALGYKKPPDHYYSAIEIEAVLRKYFTPEVEKLFPFDSLPFLSMYRIVRFKKEAD